MLALTRKLKNNLKIKMTNKNNYLALQPVVDRDHAIVGYELLFRNSKSNSANVQNNFVASIDVISDTLSNFGLE